MGIGVGSGLSLPVMAQTAAPEPFSAAPLTSLLIGLTVVVVLIILLAWLVKRMTGFTPVNHDVFKVLASYPMGTRERLVLMDVGGRQLLLGVTPGRIECLHAFDEPIVDPARKPPVSEFQKKLQAVLGRGAPP